MNTTEAAALAATIRATPGWAVVAIVPDWTGALVLETSDPHGDPRCIESAAVWEFMHRGNRRIAIPRRNRIPRAPRNGGQLTLGEE